MPPSPCCQPAAIPPCRATGGGGQYRAELSGAARCPRIGQLIATRQPPGGAGRNHRLAPFDLWVHTRCIPLALTPPWRWRQSARMPSVLSSHASSDAYLRSATTLTSCGGMGMLALSIEVLSGIICRWMGGGQRMSSEKSILWRITVRCSV
jgi:hypothetical protein